MRYTKLIVDNRTRLGRELKRHRQRLLDSLGHVPSSAETILIDRVIQKTLRCERFEEAIQQGDHSSESFYISLCNSLRRDLVTLGIRGSMKEPVPVKEGLDLNKLSVEDLLALRRIVLKGTGQVIEESPPLLEYSPESELVVEEPTASSEDKEPEVIYITPCPPTPSPQKGETEEERQARIENYHHEKMMKEILDSDWWP